VDEDEEEEEWHLDVEDDDIQNAMDININEIEDEIDVEKIVKQWQIFVPFINRGMKHPCAQLLTICQCRMQTTFIFANYLELINNLVSVSSSVQNQSY
jgi:hypothetical protein